MSGRILNGALSNGFKSVGLTNSKGFQRFSYHRLAATEFVDNPQCKMHVDHIDRNKTNNCSYNLRWVTISENHMNRTKAANKSSSYKGVSFDKLKETWKAYIRYNTVKLCLGTFDDEDDAARAYNIKASELFGEFANLNVITDSYPFLVADDSSDEDEDNDEDDTLDADVGDDMFEDGELTIHP